LKEIIDDKPKYLILVEQDLELNNKKVDYKFVYSSKHNFFKIIRIEERKKNILDKLKIIKRTIAIPETIDDQNITLDDFIETVLDHCVYSDLKNIYKPDRKQKLIFKEFGDCKIKFLNEKNLNNLTLEKFVKNTNPIKKTVKKEVKKDKKKISDEVNVDNENITLSFYWDNLKFPIIANLKMNSKKSGEITLKISDFEYECVGTLASISSQVGSWSIICPDDKNRNMNFQRNMAGSGSVKILKDKRIKGKGFDLKRNKIEFISNKIYE